MINKELSNVEELKDRLPVSPDDAEDFFETLSDGIILAHLLNLVLHPKKIDMNIMNKGTNLTKLEIC